MDRRKIAGKDDLRRIAEAVIAILVKQGLRVEHEGALDALEADGVAVDRNENVAHWTESQIAAFLDARPDRGQHKLSMEVPAEYSASMGYEIDPYYYDYPSHTARLGTADDLVTMVKLADCLPEVTSVGAPVIISDVASGVEPLESLVLCLLHTKKNVSAVSLYSEHDKYFIEIASIMSGKENDTRYIGTGGFLTSPLTLGARMAELIFAARALGLRSTNAGTMSIAGMSAPLTTAGCAAVGAAEILGGWLVAKAINPGLERFTGGTCSGVLDMRTMRACFGTPEAALQDATIALVFEQEFGGGVGIAGMGYTDAQVPGLQCLYEKMFKGMCIAGALGRPLSVHNPGILDAGRTFSPTQFMLDLETDRSLWEFDRGLVVNDDTLGLEAVWEAGLHSGAGYIGAGHTLRHYRDALWYPRLFDRRTDSKMGGGTEAELLAKAEESWRAAVSKYEKPDIGDDKVKALTGVLQRAREELL